jgi:hypothetical protein
LFSVSYLLEVTDVKKLLKKSEVDQQQFKLPGESFKKALQLQKAFLSLFAHSHFTAYFSRVCFVVLIPLLPHIHSVCVFANLLQNSQADICTTGRERCDFH